MANTDVADSSNEYIISDSKVREIEMTLSNYLHHSGMSENERREFIYDLCDTIHPCLYNVFFKYNSKIEGYNVEGTFGITEDGSTDYQTYNSVFASLYFSSNTHTFQIYHHTFLPITEGLPDTLKPLDCIELEYIKPQFSNPRIVTLDSIRNLPFAFVDINFDGEKELLLANPGNGQKTISTYRAYLLPEIEDFNPFKGYMELFR